MASRLLYVSDPAQAGAEIERHGGRILHRLGDRVWVVVWPEHAPPPALNSAAPATEEEMDYESRQLAEMWRAAGRERERPDPKKGLPWDAEGHEPPRAASNDHLLALHEQAFREHIAAAGTPGPPWNFFLNGSVAVAVWIVNGPNLQFTPNEVAKVHAQALSGLDWLITNPGPGTASLTWSWPTSNVTAPPYGSAVLPNTRISESPNLVVFNGRLYCFHQSSGKTGQLWFTSWADGVNWSADQQVPTSACPARPPRSSSTTGSTSSTRDTATSGSSGSPRRPTV